MTEIIVKCRTCGEPIILKRDTVDQGMLEIEGHDLCDIEFLED